VLAPLYATLSHLVDTPLWVIFCFVNSAILDKVYIPSSHEIYCSGQDLVKP